MLMEAGERGHPPAVPAAMVMMMIMQYVQYVQYNRTLASKRSAKCVFDRWVDDARQKRHTFFYMDAVFQCFISISGHL